MIAATRRRLFVCLPVLLAGALPLACATPAQICDVKSYQLPAVLPESGRVTVSWTTNANLPANTYEWTVCDKQKRNCHIQLAQKHDYSNVCRLHDLAHGLLHSLEISGHE